MNRALDGIIARMVVGATCTLMVNSSIGLAAATYAVPPAHCGVYSLYTALRIEGVRVSLADLLQPKYISAADGSTFADLRRAAREHCMDAALLTNLDLSDLKAAKCPIILHVKNEWDAPDYNH